MRHQRAQDFLGRLPELRNELPFSPDLLRRLTEQTRADSQSSLDAVAETLSADQGLATRVLVMANSAFYGLQAEVASVGRAVAVLGLREVRNIVLALGIKGLCSTHSLPSQFDLKQYWTHQVTVSLLAAELARLHGAAPDMLFTAGLLHDLGKLILALQCPDDWLEIHAAAESRGVPFCDAEDAYWGIDHAVAGALLLRSWDLPAALCEPVNWHHAPGSAPEYQLEAAILCLANALAHRMDSAGERTGRGARSALQLLELDPELALREASDAVRPEMVDEFVALLA